MMIASRSAACAALRPEILQIDPVVVGLGRSAATCAPAASAIACAPRYTPGDGGGGITGGGSGLGVLNGERVRIRIAGRRRYRR